MATYFSPSRFVSGTSLGNLYVRLTVDPQSFLSGMGAARGSLTDMNSVLAGFGKAAATAIAALGAVAAVSVREYAKFDKAMTNSLSIMEGVNEGMRASMEETAKVLSTQTTKSAAELAEGYFFLASAGLDAVQSMKALPVVAELATAGTMSMTEATNQLVNAQAALGLTSQDAEENMRQMVRIADVLAKADMVATGTIEEFADALTNKAAASMRQFGIDLEEGMAVLAAFAQQGLRGRAAGEAFSMFVRDIQKAAIKNKDVFQEMGIAVYDSNKELRNTADILKDVEKAFNGASDETKRETLNLMGFQDRSLRSVMALMGMSEQVRKFEADMRKAGGTLETIFKKQMESFIAVMTVAWHQIQVVLIELGAQLAPTLIEVGVQVVELVKAFAKWNSETGFLLGTLTTVIDVVKSFGLGLISIWSALKALAIIIATQVRISIEVWGQAINSSIELVKLLWDSLKSLAEAYVNTAKAAAGFGVAVWKAMKGDFAGAKEEAQNAVVGIVDGFKNAGSVVSNAVTRSWQIVQDGITKEIPVVTELLNGAFNDLADEMDTLMDKYQKLFPSDQEKASRVKKVLDDIKKATDALAKAYDDAKKKGDNLNSTADQVLNSHKVQALMRLLGAPMETRRIQSVDVKKLIDSISGGVQGGLNTAEAERMLTEAGLGPSGQSSVGSMLDPGSDRALAISREIDAEKERLKILEQLAKMEKGVREDVIKQNIKNMEAYNDRIKQLQWAQAQVLVQSGQETFDALADAAEGFAGKQSSIYKSMFAISKAFAIAESLVKIQQGIANALSLPYPANLVAAMSVAAAGANIASTISAVKLEFAGEKAEGGPVTGGKAYLVGERGPEMFIPGRNGNIIPNDQLGGNQRDVKVIVNNYSDAQATVTERQDGQERVIEVLVRRVKNEISSEIRDGRGEVRRSLEGAYKLRRGQ